ncbi:membrane protein [Arthrobacter phage Atuin]|nr:membrane protein [Arthrobacter phage Atuin]
MFRAFIIVCSVFACIFFEIVLAYAIPPILEPMIGVAMSAVLGLVFVLWAGLLMLLGLVGYHWLMQGIVKGYVGAR